MSSFTENASIDDNELVLLLVKNIKEYAIYAMDADGNIKTWNDGAMQLKQYSGDEIKGRHFSIFYTKEDRKRNRPAQMLEIARSQGKSEEEGWRVRKDGSRFWAHVVITAIFDDNSNLRGFAKVTQDLTEKKMAADREEILYDIAKESAQTTYFEDFLQYILHRIGTYLTWPLGHVYLWNDRLQVLKSTNVWYQSEDTDRYSEFRKISEDLTFESGVGLPGRCHKEKDVIFVENVDTESYFSRKSALQIIDLHSVVCIPLVESGQVFAVLEFFTKGQILDIKPIIDLAQLVSIQVSRLLERQRMLEEQALFFNNSKDLLCFTGFDGYFKRASPSWLDVMGYTPEEVREIPWAEFLHPEDLESALSLSRVQIENGSAVNAEVRFRHKDGSYRWVHWHTVPNMEREMIYAIGRDTTEERENERGRQETLALRNAMLDSTGYGMICVNLEGIVTVFNKGAEKLLGYKAEQFVGQTNPPSLTDRETLDERSKDLSNVLGKSVVADAVGFIEFARQGIKHEFEWTYVRSDGSRFPALLAVTALRDENQEMTGYMGIIQDMSARREAEAGRDILLAIIEQSPDLISFGDEYGQVLYQNAGGNRLLGYSDDFDFSGMQVKDFHPEWVLKMIEGEIPAALRQNGVWQGETALLHRDGTEIPSSQVVFRLPRQEGEPKLIATIARNIADFKRAEELLAQQATALRLSNQELEQFAYVASHDLQEPLRMVCSFLGLLELEFNDILNDDAREYVHYAIDGGMRMHALIDGLLDFSRVGRQSIDLVPIDMEDVFNEAKFNLSFVISEASAEISHDPLPCVLGDKVSLVRLMQNLLSNSLKFRTEMPVNIHVSSKRGRNKEVILSVSDNGIGIDPKHEEKIFMIFQRLHPKSKYTGSGIGLSICRKIVERHGGRLWLDTNHQNGAKFCFTLKVSK